MRFRITLRINKEINTCQSCSYYVEKEYLCSYMKIRVLPRTNACIYYRKRE